MEESSDPQPAGLEAAGAGRSGAAAPERVAVGAEHGCGSGPPWIEIIDFLLTGHLPQQEMKSVWVGARETYVRIWSSSRLRGNLRKL